MNSTRSAVQGIRAVAILLASVSCGDDDEGPTGNNGSFEIAASPATPTIQAGSNTSITVTLTRTGGYNEVVTLAISGLPDGVSATMDPAQLLGTVATSRIDLSSTASAATGTSTLTITGSGSGANASSTTVALTVTAPPDYTLSGNAGEFRVAASSSGTTTVNINRSNFTGPVTLSLSSPPAGISGTFDPSPTTTDASTLTLAVGATVQPGVYPLTVQGSATGVAQRQASLQVTVLPPVTTGNNVQYTYCDAGNAPVFFAFQDGTGPWQPVQADPSGSVVRFTFNLTSGRGGVMAVHQFDIETALRMARFQRPTPKAAERTMSLRRGSAMQSAAALITSYVTQVVYGMTSELAADGAATCALTLPTKDIRATIAGLAQFQYSVMSLGDASTIFQGGVDSNPVTLSGVQGGLVNFTATRLPATGSAPDRAVMFRNLDLPDGSQLPSTVDFNGPLAFVPASAIVTINGTTSEALEVYNEVITPTGRTLFWNDIAPRAVTTRPWAGLNAANTEPGDFHSIIVFASVPNSSDFSVATKFVGPVANQSITIPPAVPPATVSQVTTGSYPRMRFQGTLPVEYNRGVGLSLLAEGDGNMFTALVTGAYLAASGSATAYDVSMPDVASLAGFPVNSRLTPGANAVITDAFGFTGEGVFQAVPAVGKEERASVRIRSVVIP